MLPFQTLFGGSARPSFYSHKMSVVSTESGSDDVYDDYDNEFDEDYDPENDPDMYEIEDHDMYEIEDHDMYETEDHDMYDMDGVSVTTSYSTGEQDRPFEEFVELRRAFTSEFFESTFPGTGAMVKRYYATEFTLDMLGVSDTDDQQCSTTIPTRNLAVIPDPEDSEDEEGSRLEISQNVKALIEELPGGLLNLVDKSRGQPMQFGSIGLPRSTVEEKDYVTEFTRPLYHVPSSSNHFQCANALTLGTRLPMSTIDGTVWCQRPTLVCLNRIVQTRWNGEWPDKEIKDLYPFTTYSAQGEPFPPFNSQVNRLFRAGPSDPICTDQAYGFFANGSERHIELHSHENVLLLSIPTEFMSNSLQIIRRRHDSDFEYFLMAARNNGSLSVWTIPRPPHVRKMMNKQDFVSVTAPFARKPINDARISPNGRLVAAVGDLGLICVLPVKDDDSKSIEDGGWFIQEPECRHLPVPDLSKLLNLPPTTFQAQYLAWHPESELFATSCDSHPCALIWNVEQCLQVIPCGAETFAIAWNPVVHGLLAVANRYGFVHLLDNTELMNDIARGDLLETTVVLTTRDILIADCKRTSFAPSGYSLRHYFHQITGIKWDASGRFLIEATNARTLIWSLLSERIPSLKELCIQAILEKDINALRTPRLDYLAEYRELVNADILEEMYQYQRLDVV
jgi:hypothetical protein